MSVAVPLTVRPRPHVRPKFTARRPKAVPAAVASIDVARRGYTAVSLFEDKTLQRGDAVMTAKGLRIFAGSRSFPFVESDFVALSKADWVSSNQRKPLLEIDQLNQG
jgi:hypothetical protein